MQHVVLACLEQPINVWMKKQILKHNYIHFCFCHNFLGTGQCFQSSKSRAANQIYLVTLKQQRTDRQRHSLFLSDMCLLWSIWVYDFFLEKVAKIVGTWLTKCDLQLLNSIAIQIVDSSFYFFYNFHLNIEGYFFSALFLSLTVIMSKSVF